VRLLVGASKEEYTVHKQPLCAASKFFEMALEGNFSEGHSKQVELPEDIPDLVDFLCDWLYASGTSNMSPAYVRARLTWQQDHFWLKVHHMADRLMIPGLQLLALNQIQDMFNSKVVTMPSRTMLTELCSEETKCAIQLYVIEHVAYWLLRSDDKMQWGALFTVNDRFGAEMASAMLRSESKDTPFTHPEDQYKFFANYGMNLAEIRNQARLADQELPDLAKAKILSEH
jgi:hypothetical protein